MIGFSSPSAMPLAVAAPMRSPVKLPGPAASAAMSGMDDGPSGLPSYLYHVLAPQPMAMKDLIGKLNVPGRNVIFLGDGVPVYRAAIDAAFAAPHFYAPGHLSLQRAASTAILAGLLYETQGESVLRNADEFRPEYLRRTQAEQQRRKAEETGRMAALSAGRLVRELRAEEPK